MLRLSQLDISSTTKRHGVAKSDSWRYFFLFSVSQNVSYCFYHLNVQLNIKIKKIQFWHTCINTKELKGTSFCERLGLETLLLCPDPTIPNFLFTSLQPVFSTWQCCLNICRLDVSKSYNLKIHNRKIQPEGNRHLKMMLLSTDWIIYN